MTAHLMLVNGAKGDYADALAGAGYRVTTVATMREALAARQRPDAVILELLVPEENLPGIKRATRPGRTQRTMTVIALAEAAHEQAVVGAGAAFCPRPCPPDELVSLVRRTLAQRPKLRQGRGPQGRSRRV